jgi:thiamine kinase-like enzyme
MIDLKEFKKIATGGQAEIYDLLNGKILRLMLRSDESFLIDYEYQSLQIAKKNGLLVPEVFEKVNVENRPGFIMEKIDGLTLTSIFQKKPYLLFKKTKELSEIHYKLNRIKAPENLLNLKAQLKKHIEKSVYINFDIKNFVYGLLNQLPDGDRLCHGDFHPGNILIKDGNPYIIDWCGATKADPISDVAHTYLLFKNVPRIPGSSWLSFEILNLAGLLSAKTYLKEYQKKHDIDLNQFSKWLLVRAAERTYFGMQSEKESLQKFILKCKKDYEKQKANLNWHNFL